MPFSIVSSVHGEHPGKETTYYSAPVFSYLLHLCDVEICMVKKKVCIHLMSEIKIDFTFQIHFVSSLDVKELTFVYNVLGPILGTL